MPIRQDPANLLLNSFFFFSLFLFPFSIVRLYFYFNYFYTTHPFQGSDFFWMLFVGMRFDLCVLGFLLIPSYLLYLVSFLEKLSGVCALINQVYKILVWVLIVLIFHFNLPFLAYNLGFDLPYWMRWEDYQSVFLHDCQVCYWDYGYLDRISPIQIIVGIVFVLILFGSLSKFKFFYKGFSWPRELAFLLIIVLLARGKLGQHHLRYEDSLWHKNALINELSNNPLWLLDKAKIYRRP